MQHYTFNYRISNHDSFGEPQNIIDYVSVPQYIMTS